MVSLDEDGITNLSKNLGRDLEIISFIWQSDEREY
jgi:hypothetical protein